MIKLGVAHKNVDILAGNKKMEAYKQLLKEIDAKEEKEGEGADMKVSFKQNKQTSDNTVDQISTFKNTSRYKDKDNDSDTTEVMNFED